MLRICAPYCSRGDAGALLALNKIVAEREGAILPIQAVTHRSLVQGDGDYDLDRLLEECAVSTNTAAAGGNASLMSSGRVRTALPWR